MEMLTTQQVLDARLDDWRKLAQAFHARFRTGDFGTGVEFVTAVGEAADAAGHHPEVTLTDQVVDLRVVSHDAVYRADDGTELHGTSVTRRDVDLARRISEIAREQGITAEPGMVTQLELALDTADLAAVGPFWAAVLTGDVHSHRGDDVRDPSGRLPTLWFQHTDAHQTPRQRFHVDVWVPPEVVEDRVAAALAAGGRLVRDGEAPSFVVLADPEDNLVCVCTYLGR